MVSIGAWHEAPPPPAGVWTVGWDSAKTIPIAAPGVLQRSVGNYGSGNYELQQSYDGGLNWVTMDVRP